MLGRVGLVRVPNEQGLDKKGRHSMGFDSVLW